MVFRPRSRPISLSAFHVEVKQHIKVLKEKEVAIANAHKLFAGERKIWPDQCERLLPPLSAIEKPVQELSNLLRSPYLPTDHHRRFLLRSLKNIDEQIQTLLPLITNFCITCQTSPKQVPKQRRAIEQRLATISTEYNAALNNLQSLSDLTRFREKATTPWLQQSTDISRESHFYEKHGSTYSDLGMKEQARDCLEDALRSAQRIGDLKKECSILNELGRTLSTLGMKEKARDYLLNALRLVQEMGNLQLEGKVRNNLSLVYLDLGDREKAYDHLNQALLLVREITDRCQEGRIQNTFGLMFDDIGQKEQAKICFEQALSIRKELYDRRGEGITLNNLGWLYDSLSQKEQARRHYEEALSICQEEGDLWGEGKTLGNLGRFYRGLGEYEKALSLFQLALQVLREVGDRWEQCRTLNNLAIIYSYLGQRSNAYVHYEEALKISREAGDRKGEGRILSNIKAFTGMDRTEEIWKRLENALKINREVGDLKGEGWTLHNIGWLYLQENHYEQSLASLLLAKQSFKAIQSADLKQADKCIEDLHSRIGKDQFDTLLQNVEPRATEIVEQTLRNTTG